MHISMHWPGLYNCSGYIVFLAELKHVMCPGRVVICQVFVSSCSENPFKVEKELVSAECPLVRSVDLGELWESRVWMMSSCQPAGGHSAPCSQGPAR